MKSLPPLILLLLLSAAVCAEPLTVPAERGDGIYSLLRRYQLLDYSCNLREFTRRNQLNNNSILHAGEKYVLPVEVLTYDGKSIRSTTNNQDWDRAVAIQAYNEALLAAGLREADYRKNLRLYVPFHIDNCPALEEVATFATEELTEVGEVTQRLKDLRSDREPIPPPDQVTTSGYRKFAIFGPEHEDVPLIDNKLAGRIFYIVSGHGGPDPGAVGRRGSHVLAEDEYAYDVALRLTRNILQHGGTPYMIVRDANDGIRDQKFLTPDKDETVWGGASLPRGQKARLHQRSDIINALYDENLAAGITDQTMIAVHVDSRQKGKRIDVFFYYPEGDLIGARQADRIHRTMRAKYDQYRPGRGYAGTVKERDLHMLRETKPSGVYIELANIANASDQHRILLPRNRQLLADWITLGLIERD